MSESPLVYFGTHTHGNSNSKGIYVSTFKGESGQSEPQLATAISNPSFLAVHPERPPPFVAIAVRNFNGEGIGAVAAYIINRATGKLSHLNTQPPGGAHTCHISIDNTGRVVLGTN